MLVLPVPVVDVGSIWSLLHYPSRITLAPLRHNFSISRGFYSKKSTPRKFVVVSLRKRIAQKVLYSSNACTRQVTVRIWSSNYSSFVPINNSSQRPALRECSQRRCYIIRPTTLVGGIPYTLPRPLHHPLQLTFCYLSWIEAVMAMTTISADASQCVFEFLHAELVSYMLDRPKTDKVSCQLDNSRRC